MNEASNMLYQRLLKSKEIILNKKTSDQTQGEKEVIHNCKVYLGQKTLGNIKQQDYERNQYVYRQGETVRRLYIVVEGQFQHQTKHFDTEDPTEEKPNSLMHFIRPDAQS
jgi:hypothetical protein